MKKEFRRIDSEYSEDNALVMFLNILFPCNYKCHYCYAEKSNRIMSKENMDKIIKFLNEYKEKNPESYLSIEILGGEPFLHKHLFYLIENLMKIKDMNILLFTNFSKIDDKKIKWLNKYENSGLKIMLSAHPEYFNYDYVENFLHIVNNLKIDIEPTLVLDKKYKDRIKCFINRTKGKMKIPFTYTCVNIDNKDISTIDDFKEIINEENVVSQGKFKFGNKIYNYKDMYKLLKNKYNYNYKNKVLCYNTCFSVDPDLNIKHCCDGNRKYTLEEILSLNKVKLICPIRYCDPNCYFDTPKIFFK